jgi:hypothetical protein
MRSNFHHFTIVRNMRNGEEWWWEMSGPEEISRFGLVGLGLVRGPDAMPRAHPAAAPLTNPYKLAGMGVYLVLISLD